MTTKSLFIGGTLDKEWLETNGGLIYRSSTPEVRGWRTWTYHRREFVAIGGHRHFVYILDGFLCEDATLEALLASEVVAVCTDERFRAVCEAELCFIETSPASYCELEGRLTLSREQFDALRPAMPFDRLQVRRLPAGQTSYLVVNEYAVTIDYLNAGFRVSIRGHFIPDSIEE